MNKNIIIAILAVIIIALVAAFMFSQPANKLDTQINFLSEDTLQNGEQVQFELKDSKGNVLTGQTVNIVFNNNENYSITTDQNGRGYVTINGEDAGSYDIEITYDGDDRYNGCSAKDTITITDDEADNPASETDSGATADTGSNTSSNTSSNSTSSGNSSWPDVDSSGVTREEAEQYGWTYTPDHGGHYIGPNDVWDPNTGTYHD